MQKIHLTVLSAVLVVLTAGTSVLAQQSTARQQAPEKPYHQQIREEPPQSRAESTKVLSNLYAHLAAATDAQSAKEIAETIERLWLLPYSDTIAVLMERSATALAQKNNALALKLLDAVVDLAPDYAEGWHRRAVVHFSNNDYMRALGDLRRALALEPNHFKALDGLAHILRELNRDRQALQAYRQLLSVNPYYSGAADAVRELEREVEGQGI